MERGRRGGTAVEGRNGGGGAGDLVGWWGRTVEGRRMEGGFFFFCYFFRGVFGKCLEDGEKPEHSTENQWKVWFFFFFLPSPPSPRRKRGTHQTTPLLITSSSLPHNQSCFTELCERERDGGRREEVGEGWKRAHGEGVRRV